MKSSLKGCACVVLVLALGACNFAGPVPAPNPTVPTVPSDQAAGSIRERAKQICGFIANMNAVIAILDKMPIISGAATIGTVAQLICDTAREARILKASQGLRAPRGDDVYGEIEGIPLRGQFERR